MNTWLKVFLMYLALVLLCGSWSYGYSRGQKYAEKSVYWVREDFESEMQKAGYRCLNPEGKQREWIKE